jgi:CDP-diglyceride synthetase
VSTAAASTTSTSTTFARIAQTCRDSGAYQLWFILLAIFFVIVAFVGLSEPPLAKRHDLLPIALIGVPLLVLLWFWYYLPDCRLSGFIPVILLVAAALGLYGAYRTDLPTTKPIALPASKKTETKTETKTATSTKDVEKK